MRRNKQDFEPFFASDEGVDFNRHLELLAADGTYAGISEKEEKTNSFYKV